MLDVYKVNVVEANSIKYIYVFSGDRTGEKQPQDEEVFSKKTLDEIRRKNIQVVYVNDAIYGDDSISTVKKKILIQIGQEHPFEALYMFGKSYNKLNSVTTYQLLSQKGKMEITRLRLLQFLYNIGYDAIDNIPIKEGYDYDDILSLGLDNKEWLVTKPIGQHFVAMEGNYSYTVNPYNVTYYDRFLEKNASDLITTRNSQLLMDSGELSNQNIYLCLATDVLDYAKRQDLPQESTMRIYFPMLVAGGIETIGQYYDNEKRLLKETKALLSKSFLRQIQNIQMLNNVYEMRNKEVLIPAYTGFDKLEFIIHPVYSFNLPLDIVFKILHATLETPMIKLNPGKSQEKVYRLFTDKIAIDGRKVPVLSRINIMKLAKQIAKKQSVSVYIEAKDDDGMSFICSFNDNADVHIECAFGKVIDIDTANSLIQQHVNPVINVVSSFLSQSGYTLDVFDKLENQNIEVLDLTYRMSYSIDATINLGTMVSCLSPVFNILQGNLKDKSGISLQYKRVSDFSEMDSQEAFIVHLLRKGLDEEEVIQNTVENFNIEEMAAREKLASILNSVQLIQNVFQNKRVKIKTNPGFPVSITREPATNDIIIVVERIDDISYLPYISHYIDSTVRITQGEDTTDYPAKEIKSLCKGRKTTVEKPDTIIDIIAPTEKAITEAQDITIVGNELEFGAEGDSEFLDILLGDDEEDEDNEGDEGDEGVDIDIEQSGGQDSDDSDEPVIEFGEEIELEDDENDEDDDEDEEPNIVPSQSIPKPKAQKQKTEKLTKDITGLSLISPNPFFKRMRDRDPSLFLTKEEGKFKAYSRICPWSARRQPVILTEEEKARIDKEHPGSYEHSIKYGTDPNKQFYYICPKYWSLTENTSLTEEEVKSGKYGKVIDASAISVPPGETIFEFNHKNRSGKYQPMYPGFVKPGSHPDGYCLPCCFTNWNAPKQKQARDECGEQMMKMEKQEDLSTKQELVGDMRDIQTIDSYIMGAEKFPLEEGRLGFLPPILQMFFDTDGKECVIGPSDPTLKLNTPCLLRQGIEANKTQSFLGVVAFAYAEFNNEEILSISGIKKQLVSAVSLDNFEVYQNGDLIELFYDPERDDKDINIELYKSSTIAKRLLIDTEKGMKNNDGNDKERLFKKIVNAYTNFLDFLMDPNVEIDYTYIWDLITIPNEKLFPKGLNLAILETLQDDITGNLRLLCPTNHYSRDMFDIERKTLIVYKVGNYYEPLTLIENRPRSIAVTRTFSLKNIHLMDNLREALTVIKDSSQDMCPALQSMPNVYKFKTNVSAEEVVHQLLLRDYVIHYQVVNYMNKTIGIVASKDRSIGYLPTYPSFVIPTFDSRMIDDNTIDWNNYSNTFDFLTEARNITTGKILSKPKYRITEDGVTVGILTETNQVVMLKEPELVTDDTLPIVNENMSIVKSSVTSEIGNGIDTEREKYVLQIEVETDMFNAFRNTIRILLSDFKKQRVRDEIENITVNRELDYVSKLKRVIKLLKELSEDKFLWISSEEFEKDWSSSAQTNPQSPSCIKNTEDNCDTSITCKYQGRTCKLKLPETNLINGKPNKELYYGRMADEILRYSRIRSFIFQPQSFLSFGKIGYNLRDDEIILLQTSLTNEYFDSLEVASSIRYVNNNTYDTARPVTSVAYSDIYVEKTIQQADVDEGDKEEQKAEKQELEFSTMRDVTRVDITSKKWKTFFPRKTVELVFESSQPIQSFDLLVTLLQHHQKSLGNVNEQDIKEMLAEIYEEKYSDMLIKITNVWLIEGKRELATLVAKGELDITTAVLSDSYYATMFDYILIANKFNIPIVFYSGTKLSLNEKTMLITRQSEQYYFVKVSATMSNKPPAYRLAMSDNKILIKRNDFSDESLDMLNAVDVFDIDSYLQDVKKPKVRKLVVQPKIDKPETTIEIKTETTAKPKSESKVAKPAKKKKLKLVLKA